MTMLAICKSKSPVVWPCAQAGPSTLIAAGRHRHMAGSPTRQGARQAGQVLLGTSRLAAMRSSQTDSGIVPPVCCHPAGQVEL